jgi:hypothetical protein
LRTLDPAHSELSTSRRSSVPAGSEPATAHMIRSWSISVTEDVPRGAQPISGTLAATANTYTQVLTNESELDYVELVG